MPVGEIDLARLQNERDQLLAEAVHLFKAGERWWLTPEEETQRAEVSSRFVEVDPWETQVLAYAKQQAEVRTADILDQVLQIPIERRDRRADMRVAFILRRNGYIPVQRRTKNGKVRLWIRPNSSGRRDRAAELAEMPASPGVPKERC